MNITTVNQLILDHLRFYGYQLAARIVESEIKTKPPREQPKPSKLLETLLKFVELYGKPDLWGSDASLQNISDNEDRRQIGLPRMDRAPFKGVHGNKSESYGGPFNRTKDNNEPYRITNSTARSNPIGRNTFASAGIKSTQMGMLGNKFIDIGPVGNPVKGTPNQHASHLTSIANALRDKSPPGGGVPLYQEQTMMMDMKRGGASSHQSSTYVGPYAIANQSFNKDEGRSFDERDNNNSFVGPVGYMPERNMEPFAPKRDKQTRSTSVPQAESRMYEGIMKEKPVYGRRANNNTRHDSYIEDSEASTMDMEPSYASNPVVERDRAPMRNPNPNPKSFYEGEAAAPQGGRVTFKRETQEQFGRVEKAVRPVPVHNEEREEMPRRDWKAASEKKPPGNGMIQDYNVFLARHGNQQERPFGSGTKVPQGRQGGNMPPTFRVDSESSMETNQPFGREYNQQQQRGNKGGREEYKEGAPKVYFGERESQQNLFEKSQSVMERNQKYGEERFEGRTSQVEVGYGSRGGSKGYMGDNFERRRPPGDEYRNENRSFQGEDRDRSSELDGQTLEYLKRDTKLQEGEIRRLYGIYAGLDGKLGYEGGLEKTKFTEFLKRGKGIDSRCFTDNLFKFGSQMGLLNGMPPKIGFEEALIVQNQLTQTNPTELMKFLFMVGSGGSRETKLSLIESMLKELHSGENRDVIGMLLDSINYASSQGRGSKEDLVSLEKYWGMTADFEPLRRHF